MPGVCLHLDSCQSEWEVGFRQDSTVAEGGFCQQDQRTGQVACVSPALSLLAFTAVSSLHRTLPFQWSVCVYSHTSSVLY